MYVRGEKFTEEQVINAPTLQKKPISNTHNSSQACPGPYETLIERVVDFMDTYNEN